MNKKDFIKYPDFKREVIFKGGVRGYSYFIYRIKESLKGEIIHAPQGMNREEKRAFILKHAK